MFKSLFRLRCDPKSSLMLLLAIFLFTPSPAAAESDKVQVSEVISHFSVVTPSQPSLPVSEPLFEPNQPTVELEPQVDPLGSPHPVPWEWIVKNHEQVSGTANSGLRYYRSPSLISPDGKYAAYSRLQMQVDSVMYRSRVTSVMFLENLETGALRSIKAASPLANNPLIGRQEAEIPGTMSILIPVSWSEDGDRLLARQLEGFFNTSDVSDYAVIWDRQSSQITTVSPKRIDYTNAVLLGWSQNDPNQVLFQAGMLGEEEWPIWSVNAQGQTALASQDEPVVHGQLVHEVWSGSQALLY